jgi:hypothetical protein
MHILRSIGRRVAPIGVALAVGATAVLVTPGMAWAADDGSLSTNVGPSGGGNWVRVTAGTGTPFGTVANIEIQFQYNGVAGPNDVCLAAAGRPATDAPVTFNATTGAQNGGVFIVTAADSGAAGDLAAGSGNTNIDVLVPNALTLSGTQLSANYNVCAYDSTTAAGVGTLVANVDAGATGYTIYPKVTLSPGAQKGPTAGGNPLTITSGTPNTFSTDGTYGVQFVAATADSSTLSQNWCPSSWAATGVTKVAATPDGVISGTKLVVTVPSGLLVANGANWHICVYQSAGTSSLDASNLLIAGTGQMPDAAAALVNTYKIAATATVTTVFPSAGAAQGGTRITVRGTNLPTSGLVATLAGQTLAIVGTPTTTSFVATVPAHVAGGPYNLIVSTGAGDVTKTNAFTYTNGIVVTPNTAPSTRFLRTYSDVRGVGFGDLVVGLGNSSQTKGTSPNSAGAHIYLVNGKYNPAPPAANGTTKSNGQLAECVDVIVVDDTEIVCSFYLAGRVDPPARTTTVGCTAGTSSATSATLTFGGSCNLTAADVGSVVTVTSGTALTQPVIVSAVGTTSATLSKAVTILATQAMTLTPKRALADITYGTTTAGNITLTSAGTPFIASDAGRAVYATGFLPGLSNAVVSTVSTAGVATLNVSACLDNNGVTATCPTTTVSVDVLPITVTPVGVYTVTLVSNGAVNGQTAVGYSQSIISSGATFTVADY